MAGGRPLKFESVEEVQILIEEYFKDCADTDTPYTITGLALALNTCRQTLLNYEEKSEFLDTIKTAKLRVENDYEIALRNRGGSGEIFGLKNFGWSDKQEIDQNTRFTDKDGNDLHTSDKAILERMGIETGEKK